MIDRRLVAPLLAIALAGCSPDGDRPGAEAPPAELAPYMDRLQRQGAKLGYAIQARNLRLAEFYLAAIERSLEQVAAKVPEQDGYPIARLVDQVALPGLAPLEEALTVRSWSRIDSAYTHLVETCNSCHAATEREFIVLLPAGSGAPFDQRFAPGSE